MDIICLSASPAPASEGISIPLPAQLAARATSLRGVSYTGGRLRFDPSVHTEETADLLTRRLKGEELAATFQGLGRPAEVTDEDLRIINDRHSEQELTADDVEVFERYSANDALMRRPLKFTLAALEKFASDFSEGRSVLVQHDDGRAIGRTFAAKVEKATVRGVEANWLVTRWYAVTLSASEERLQDIQDVRTGVWGYDSITFANGTWELRELEGKDGETMTFYEVDDAEDEHPRLEAWEVSMVNIGAVRGAGSNVVNNSPSAEISAQQQLSTSSSRDQETAICVW